MSKRPTFFLESPTIEGESRTKNHEILVREWLCAVLVSKKLVPREVVLFAYLVDASKGLRYEISKRISEIALDVGMAERHVKGFLKSLEEKGLLFISKRRTRVGKVNLYFVAMLYPEHIGNPRMYFLSANYPKLWDKVSVLINNAGDGDQSGADPMRSMHRLGDQSGAQLGDYFGAEGGDQSGAEGGALSPLNAYHDAVPSSFYSFIISSFSEILHRRIKSKREKDAVLYGIEKLISEYSHEVVWERIAMVYADKGEKVIKPNFHAYLRKNIEFYQTISSIELEKEKTSALEKMASERFLSMHEGLCKAFKDGQRERPNLGPVNEQIIRVLKIDMQREYENFCNKSGHPSVMRGIENLFINKFIMHYKNKGA